MISASLKDLLVNLTSLYVFLFFKCVLSDTGHNEVDQHQNVEENSETFPLDGNVYILTDKTFGLFLEQNPTTLVEFYAPWFVYYPVKYYLRV